MKPWGSLRTSLPIEIYEYGEAWEAVDKLEAVQQRALEELRVIENIFAIDVQYDP